MRPTPRGRTAAALVLLLLAPLLAAAATAPTAAAPSGAALRISPASFVGGQRITFAGDIGVPGRRRVKLQVNLSRPGDRWADVGGFKRRWTRADGSFRFRYLAPAMFGIRMRVVSGRLRTPPVEFQAKSQDLVVRVVPGGPGQGQVAADQPFSLVVDTTPESSTDLARRTDLPPPAFPGRALTLQRRQPDGTWADVPTEPVTTDDQGIGRFDDLRLPTGTGTAVFRVVQEDWTVGRSKVGWYPSFPVFVTVGPAGAPARRSATAPRSAPAAAPAEDPGGYLLRTTADVASRTAAERYRWRPSLWYFNWAYGESLTSRPTSGTDRTGWWEEWSDGTGRSAKHNGGLLLDSQRQNKDGYGASIGTTMTTLRGSPRTRGRWEVRLRVKSTETEHRDLRALVELVPVDAGPECRATGITVAEASPHTRGIGIGVRNAAGAEWSRTEPGVSVNGTSHAIAVEVTNRHITWFLEGEPIGTIRRRAAIPDVPLTLRLSLQGRDQQQVNRTQAIFDWMRGYSLERGTKVSKGPSLAQGTHGLPC